MTYKNILTIGLVIVLVLVSGCTDASPKSGIEKEKSPDKNPMVTSTISPTGTSGTKIQNMTLIDSPSSINIDKNLRSAANKTMTLDENWNVGGGWTLAINAIDAKLNPRIVWFTLSKDGKKLDDAIVPMGKIYYYNTSDRYFTTNVATIFAGNRSDLVLFTDTIYQID